MKVKVTQSCPALCDPMDYTVHGILQARILEQIAFPFPRGSSQPRDQIQVSHTAGKFITSWATREARENWSGSPIPSPAHLPNSGIETGSPVLQADSLWSIREAQVSTRNTNKLDKLDEMDKSLPCKTESWRNRIWIDLYWKWKH